MIQVFELWLWRWVLKVSLRDRNNDCCLTISSGQRQSKDEETGHGHWKRRGLFWRQLRERSVRGEEGDLNGWTPSEAGEMGWRTQEEGLRRAELN